MNEKKQYSDIELIQQFIQEGKPEWVFRELVERYSKKVYWQVRRILLTHDDADEVTQCVFIKLWSNLQQFQFNSAFSSFIYRIAYNESINFLKQRNRFSSFDEMLDKDGHYSSKIQYGGEMNGDEIAQKLQLALIKLPEKQRLVFNYKYFEEMQYDEISKITGTSVGALKASYHLAVEKIKKILEIN